MGGSRVRRSRRRRLAAKRNKSPAGALLRARGYLTGGENNGSDLVCANNVDASTAAHNSEHRHCRWATCVQCRRPDKSQSRNRSVTQFAELDCHTNEYVGKWFVTLTDPNPPSFQAAITGFVFNDANQNEL